MDSKTIRYNNARDLVAKAGGVSAFAERLGKGQSQTSQFAGENPIKGIGGKIAREIEEAFDKPKGWLDVPHPKADDLPLIAAWDSNTPMDDDDVNIPLLKEVEIAGGLGCQQQIEISGRLIRLSLATLRKQGVDPTNAVAATLKGTSQEPMILDGSTLGIDRGRTQIKEGRLYALDHDGWLRAKFLYPLPGNQIRLHSKNSAEHPDEIYSMDLIGNQIKVIGWVFWWSTLNNW